MIVNCFQLSDGPKILHCEYNFAIKAIKQTHTRVWIDIQDAGINELEEKLDDIGVHGVVRRFCFESRDHPGFYPIRPVALMVIPVQMEVQDANVMEYLALLFNQEFLLTIRSSKMARFQKNLTPDETTELLPDDSIQGIISSLIMGLSLDLLRKAARLSDKILAMEELMDCEHDAERIGAISDKRSELQTLESIVQGQLPIVEAIIPANMTSKTTENTMEYIIWTAANLKSADRKLDWLSHRIEVMRSIIEMRAQERINRRLGRLTVVSMIFMPITFLAGIWGMNFEWMPGLSYKFGSVIAVSSMFLIAGGLYLYFHKRGWFN